MPSARPWRSGLRARILPERRGLTARQIIVKTKETAVERRPGLGLRTVEKRLDRLRTLLVVYRATVGYRRSYRDGVRDTADGVDLCHQIFGEVGVRRRVIAIIASRADPQR